MLNDLLFVEARLRMLRSEESGRSFPIFSGYRPNHNFGDLDSRDMQIGEISIAGKDCLFPGEESPIKVKFVSHSAFPSLLPGRRWWIHEGDNVIAEAEVVRVLSEEKS